MIRNMLTLLALAGILSCHSGRSANPAGVKDSIAHATATAARTALKSLPFDYKKDPACGMPLKAGLEDTAHYEGKLYGFCSKECKAEFLKDPKSYLAQIK